MFCKYGNIYFKHARTQLTAAANISRCTDKKRVLAYATLNCFCPRAWHLNL